MDRNAAIIGMFTLVISKIHLKSPKASQSLEDYIELSLVQLFFCCCFLPKKYLIMLINIASIC